MLIGTERFALAKAEVRSVPSLPQAIAVVLSFTLSCALPVLALGLLMEYELISRWTFGAASAYAVCFAMALFQNPRPGGAAVNLLGIVFDSLRMYLFLAVFLLGMTLLILVLRRL